MSVEESSGGWARRRFLLGAVSVGVGLGIAGRWPALGAGASVPAADGEALLLRSAERQFGRKFLETHGLGTAG